MSGVIFRAIGRQVVGVAMTCVAACKACMRQPLGVSCASALLSQPVSGRSVLLAKRVHVLPFICVCATLPCIMLATPHRPSTVVLTY